ncbi:MAG: T9SS type A sorting domain-containing protein [Bacteroidales bacterium]|jgi:hypothetical protein|nr:T9SS type A sorting domain-containing protein [Bacteroidales bacterium]
MKKSIFLYLALITFSCLITLNSNIVNAQSTYGPQFENMGFETWENWNNSSSRPEPLNWHGLKSADGTWASAVPDGVLTSSTTVRPGSSGSRSVLLTTKPYKVFGITVAQVVGTLTNGRMYAGSTTPLNANNYMRTVRSNDVFNTPVTSIPDSITVWVASWTNNSSHKSFIHCAVHDDADFKLVSNGSYDPANMLVAKGDLEFSRTCASSSSLTWERKSVPFTRDGDCVSNNPRYVIASFCTSTNPSNTSEGDFLYVDDVLLVYNPALTVPALATTTYTRPVGGGAVSISIPYNIQGTMSPYNLNADANKVIAELSDANGNWGNPIQLISPIITDVSGTISGIIPASVPDGAGYKVRVRTTNYPMTTVSTSTITINTAVQQYAVSITANPTVGGTYSGSGTYNSGQSVTIIATPNSGYSFVNWTEGGNIVSTNSNYNFTISSNRTFVANFNQISTYTIAATANPVAGGSITGAGQYTHGAQVSLQATANTGYQFVNWTENGQTVSTNPLLSFNATENRNLVAHFIALYTVNLSANPVAGGSVSGGGTNILDGTQITVNAYPSSGYSFTNWTENGNIVSTNANYTFAVTSNRNLVANFTQIISYNISLSANPVSGGTVSGGGNYQNGHSLTVTAIAASGYTFQNWTESGNVVSTTASYTFTVSQNRTLVANFTQNVYYAISATVNPVGAGTISGLGSGSFASGAQVTLTAVAASGYQFVNWTENGNVVSTNYIYNFIANSNRTLIANFINLYNVSLSANPTAGGNVSGGGTFASGTEITVNAAAGTGYYFLNWTKNGNIVGTSANYTFTVTENTSLIANFNQLLTVNLSANPADGGTVSKSGTGHYQPNAEVTITATPNNNFGFINWTENGQEIATTQQYTFNITSNKTFVANFVPKYTISVSANPAEGGHVSGDGTFNENSSVTVRALPYSGYYLASWTEDGQIVSSDLNYTFQVTGNRTLIANFELIPTYNISATTNPDGAGTISGTGVYEINEPVTLRATANSGYQFQNWTEEGVIVHSGTTYSFIAVEDRELVANFIELYTINISANPANGGTVSGAGITNGTGIFTNGSAVSVAAIANTGFVFSNWTVDGNVVSTTANYSFNISSNINLVANFLPRHTLSIIVNPEGAGTYTGNGTYTQGANVTVTATPESDYTFQNWTKLGNIVSEDGAYTFQIMENTVLTANFELIPQYVISTASSPAAGGTISGAGTFRQGADVNLTATANSGYEFVNWTEEGTEVSTNNIYSFIASENRHLVANFTSISVGYDIILSANPTNGGNVSGGGNYDSGTGIEVIATPNANYEFVNWTEDGLEVSTDANYSFIVESERTLVANFNYIINYYDITLISDPTEGGILTGDGNYQEGTPITVSAIANEGYEFVNWTENGNQVSTNLNYSFTVNRNRILKANFVEIFTLELIANPINGGTVYGHGTYYLSNEVTIMAVAEEGFEFVNWTENGNVISTSYSHTIFINESRSITANFNEIFSYLVSLDVVPENAGSVSGAGEYISGSEVTITATPNSGFVFNNWKDTDDQIISTNSVYNFIIEEDVHYFANFKAQYTVSVEINPENSGYVSGAGTYQEGHDVTLSAFAYTGYEFVNWTENGNVISSEDEISFTLTENRSLVANFAQITTFNVSLTADPIEGGTVSGDGNYVSGANVTVLAVPNDYYEFINWTEDGNIVSDNAGYSFVISEDRNLVANFEEITEYNVNLTANPVEGGSVSGEGDYISGSEVTIIATANDNYNFINWTENGSVVSSQSIYTFNINGDRNLIANFEEIIQYTVTLTANPANCCTLVGDGVYVSGLSVTVAATANPNFTFVNWTKNGNVVSTDNVYEFIIVENTDLVANFDEIIQYNVVLSSNPADGGDVIGAGTYDEDTEVTILAEANDNYIFVNWTENGNVISTTTGYTFVISEDRNLVANFVTNYSYTVELSANPEEGGTVMGEGTYTEGTEVSILAVANDGYVFVNWTENGNILATTAAYEFVINNNRSLVAKFEENTLYTVSLLANPADGGIVSGSGTFSPDVEVSVVAVANDGYRFINWTENGAIVSTLNDYVFIIESNRNLTANFEQIQYHSIEVTIQNPDAGTVIGAGEYEIGTEITLIAVPYTNYTFVGWYEDGIEISNQPEFNIVVERDMNLSVMFKYSSIEDYIIENLNVYPNPANEYIIIDAPYDIEYIEIFNLSGKLVKRVTVNTNHTRINVSDIVYGSYILKIKIENNFINKKIIITK